MAVQNARGDYTTYLYDNVGNRTAFVDGRGNRVTFQYDALNRNTVLIDQLGNRTTYTLDAVGNQTLRIDANNTRTTYSFDSLDRQTGVVYQDATRVTKTYDAVSQRLTMQDSTGTTTFSYDTVRRLNKVTYPANKTVTYSFDEVGNRSVMVDPDSGRTTYGYDAANNLTSLLNPFTERSTFVYDALNRAVTVTHGNTTKAEHDFNAAGWLTALRNLKSDSSVISIFTYTYDNAANRLSMAEANGDRVTWSYDATYQLTREQRSGANAFDITYTYDATANRLTKLQSGTTTTYTYDIGNRLSTEQTGATVTTYTFDNNGNTTVKNAASQLTTYTWDGENRMTKLEQPTSPTVMTFTCDGNSYRRSLHDGTSLTKFIYDWSTGIPGLDPVLIETDTSDSTIVTYTPGMFLGLLSQRRSSVSKWYHLEGIGSTRQLTDSSQVVTDTYIYEAFGKEVAASGTTVNALRFVGRMNYNTDGKSGLVLLGVRYLAGRSGVFLTKDLVEPIDGTNLYLYVKGNPVNGVDPEGLAQPPGIPVYLMAKSTESLMTGWCGDYSWYKAWSLNRVTSIGGWIVQKVTWFDDVKDCVNKKIDLKKVSKWYPFWEAWEVKKNQMTPNPPTDNYAFGWNGKETSGKTVVDGQAYFYEGLALPKSFKVNKLSPAGILRMTQTDPKLPMPVPSGPGYVYHYLKATWNCCPKGHSEQTKVRT